jgi:phage I-like protein
VEKNRTALLASHRAALDEALDGTLPSSYLLFEFGQIATTQGTFLFDQESADSVMAAYNENGRQLSFDYNHQLPRAISGDTRDGDAPAAGWFSLEVRDSGLWLVDIQWTPQAQTRLEAREYRYLSPWLLFDPDNGRILEILNIALTNVPSTQNMLPLVASAITDLAMPSVVWDNTTGIAFAPVTDTVTGTQPAWPEYPPFSITLHPSQLEQPTKETASTRKGERMQTLMELLGLPAASSEADAVQAVTRLNTESAALLALTGQDDGTAAMATISGWKAQAEAATELSTRLEQARADLETAKLDTLIQEGTRDGKLPPKLTDWARSVGSVQLAAFLAEAPAAVNREAGNTRREAAPNSSDSKPLQQVVAELKADATKAGRTLTHLDAIVTARRMYPHLRGDEGMTA